MKEGCVLLGILLFCLFAVAMLIGVTVNVVDKRVDPKAWDEKIAILANAANIQAAKLEEIEKKLSKAKK